MTYLETKTDVTSIFCVGKHHSFVSGRFDWESYCRLLNGCFPAFGRRGRGKEGEGEGERRAVKTKEKGKRLIKEGRGESEKGGLWMFCCPS